MYIDHAFERAYLNLINEDKEKEIDDIKVDQDEDQEVDTDVDTDQETEETQNPVKKVCFLTSDPDLIDALNKGFEEVVLFVKSENENGEESVEEIKFKSDSFGDVEVTDAEEDDECPECCPECGNDPCTCDGDEEDDESDEDPDEDLDLDDEDEDETDEDDKDTTDECGKVTDSDNNIIGDGKELTEEEILHECNKLKCRTQYPY